MTTPPKKTGSRPAAPPEAPAEPADAAPDGLSISPLAAPVPSTAPLDPPTPPAGEPAEAAQFIAPVDTGVLLAQHAAENIPSARIVDAGTGDTPAVEGLFESITPHGTARRLTRRLLQQTRSGDRTDTFLLLPAGALLDATKADQVIDLIQAQA